MIPNTKPNPKTKASYLEDHPRTCKWLGSPAFKIHQKAIWKGSHNPTYSDLFFGDFSIVPWEITIFDHHLIWENIYLSKHFMQIQA